MNVTQITCKKRKKLKLAEEFYLIFISLATINYALENASVVNFVRTLNLALMLITVIFIILIRKYSIKKLAIFALIFLYGALDFYLSGYTDMVVLLLAVYLCENILIDKVLCLVFKIRLIIFMILNLLAITGMIDNTIKSVNKFTGIATAYAPGYIGGNTYACQLGILILLYLAINRYNVTLKKIFTIFTISIVSYIFDKSRTGLGLMLLLSILLLLFRNTQKKHKIAAYLMKYVYIFILVFNFVFIYLFMRTGYGNTYMDVINNIVFNGRIGLAVLNLGIYPITLFGNHIDVSVIASDHMYYMLDNGYTVLLLYYGIVGLVWYSFIQHSVLHKLYTENEFILMCISLIIYLWGLYEGQMVSLGGSFCSLILYSLIRNDKKRRSIK